MTRHRLDPYPIPKEKTPMFINEPWLIDESLQDMTQKREPDEENDNVRVYFPMDLNRTAILRRLDFLIARYGEANEKNEFRYWADVGTIVSQIEIYDQFWYVRHMSKDGKHSREAIELVEEFVKRLGEIEDGCAEVFPFELIDELKQEYL